MTTTTGHHYNFMTLIGTENQPTPAKTLADVAQVNAETAVLLEQRNEQIKTLHVLNAAHENKAASRMFLFLLPSRIAWAKLNLATTQEQIDFNIAYCDLELNRLSGTL